MGVDWHPVTNELWFTDNGRDNVLVMPDGARLVSDDTGNAVYRISDVKR